MKSKRGIKKKTIAVIMCLVVLFSTVRVDAAETTDVYVVAKVETKPAFPQGAIAQSHSNSPTTAWDNWKRLRLIWVLM